MSYPINYPTPQGANVQIFTDRTRNLTAATSFTWVKPQGASFVWFTLIGAGGNGDGTNGGGSGAVTNFMCPAFLIPDSLAITLPQPNSASSTKVRYQLKDTTPYDLLTANNGQGATAGTASTANAFTAMGFYQSVAGQAGASGDQSASTTTFLSGGNGTSGAGTLTANYGYTRVSGSGSFQLQPLIVGVGGAGGGASRGGIGCGSDATATGTATGGSGMVVIITW
jgi:hypothetical protein